MIINNNVSAIKTNNYLKRNNNMLTESLEKLSSGYRINKAADDAAGLAISQKMKTQIRGLEQASRNSADGISVLQTAEGALGEIQTMLQRMRELSVQAANGTNTLDDRSAIQGEIEELNQEIQRISDTTEFNTKTLLNGNLARKTYSSSTEVSVVTLSDSVEVKDYEFTITALGTQASTTRGTVDATAFPVTKEMAGTITINGETIEIKEGETQAQVETKLRDLCDVTGIQLQAASITSKEYGSDASIRIDGDNKALLTSLGLKVGTNVKGTDAKVTLDTTTADKKFSTTATVVTKGNKAYISDTSGFEMNIKISSAAKAGEKVTINVLDAGPLNLQIGANEGQLMEVSIPNVNPEALETENVNVCTEETAQKAIESLDKAVQTISAIRAKLGACQNRLEHAGASLDISSQNLTEALSRIEDCDMAAEMTEFTQKQVLAQANTAMLAQANERPQSILSLLQG